jgi:hypothetical protein
MPGLEENATDKSATRRKRLLHWTLAAAAVVLIGLLGFFGLGGSRIIAEVAKSWSAPPARLVVVQASDYESTAAYYAGQAPAQVRPADFATNGPDKNVQDLNAVDLVAEQQVRMRSEPPSLNDAVSQQPGLGKAHSSDSVASRALSFPADAPLAVRQAKQAPDGVTANIELAVRPEGAERSADVAPTPTQSLDFPPPFPAQPLDLPPPNETPGGAGTVLDPFGGPRFGSELRQRSANRGSRGPISGYVTRGKFRPAGVTVTLKGATESSQKTDSQGAFVFPNVPAGTYVLRASGAVQNTMRRGELRGVRHHPPDAPARNLEIPLD